MVRVLGSRPTPPPNFFGIKPPGVVLSIVPINGLLVTGEKRTPRAHGPGPPYRYIKSLRPLILCWPCVLWYFLLFSQCIYITNFRTDWRAKLKYEQFKRFNQTDRGFIYVHEHKKWARLIFQARSTGLRFGSLPLKLLKTNWTAEDWACKRSQSLKERLAEQKDGWELRKNSCCGLFSTFPATSSLASSRMSLGLSTHRASNIRRKTGYSISKNNLRTTYLGYGAIWGINSLTLIFSCPKSMSSKLREKRAASSTRLISLFYVNDHYIIGIGIIAKLWRSDGFPRGAPYSYLKLSSW